MKNPNTIMEALKSGAAQCKSIAEEVMDEVRTKMGTKPVWMKSEAKSNCKVSDRLF